MKNVLAIETSSDKASVALKYKNGALEETLSGSKSHARELLQLIEQLLEKASLNIKDLDAIVYGRGPGSFTGLRVACALAKGLAYPHGIGLIPVSTLASIAFDARRQLNLGEQSVLAVMDARMQELYWRLDKVHQSEAIEQVSKASDIQVEDKEVVLAGIGFENYAAQFTEVLQDKILQKTVIYPRAFAMIELAIANEMKTISATDAKPVYIRNKVTQGNARG
jgi:tRNA threonylcarbamoyladenosine biosynthesis protein TsaB